MCQAAAVNTLNFRRPIATLRRKDPPLDPTNPATKDQYTREVYGAVYHIGLEVTDARATRDALQKRGNYSDVRVRATVGNNRHWLIHMFDPDGTRSEIMETAVQTELVAGTMMAPGPPAPPIPPPPGTGTGRGGAGATTPAVASTQPPAAPEAAPPTGATAQAGRGGGGSRYVEPEPINYADHAGWTSMFDGKTLNGWDGPLDLWHVENGNIVVQSKAESADWVDIPTLEGRGTEGLRAASRGKARGRWCQQRGSVPIRPSSVKSLTIPDRNGRRAVIRRTWTT